MKAKHDNTYWLNYYGEKTNFKLKETKCKCCGKNDMQQDVVDKVQILRDTLKIPVYVTSGFRCPRHNKRVKGSVKSKHMKGMAIDIRFREIEIRYVYTLIDQLKLFGGLGKYNKFIHCDTRKVKTRWNKTS